MLIHDYLDSRKSLLNARRKPNSAAKRSQAFLNGQTALSKRLAQITKPTYT